MIDARRLRTLRAVADHRTVTAAAAALYLTPSAVSQQLAALEHETGHRLLERDGRGVRLTAAGEIMLTHANAVLAQLERAEAELAAYTSGAAGEVTVASFATGIAPVLAPAIARAGAHRSRASGYGCGTPRATRACPWCSTAGPDLAVAVEYRGAPRADDQRLARVRPVRRALRRWSCPPGTPSPTPGRTCASPISPARPWIGPYPGNPCHDVVVLACEYAGFQPRLAHSSDDFRAVVALAARGRGRRARAPSGAARHGPAGVAVRPVDGVAATRRVFAAVRRGAEDHPLLRPVLDALRDVAEGAGGAD